MNGKKLAFIIGIPVGIAAILAAAVLGFASCFHSTDAEVIRINWKINLTGESKDIYYKDTGPSFHGDGPRLSIMQYSDFEAVSKRIKWEDGPNKEMESKVSDILTSELKVEPRYRPDFHMQYKYYCYKKDRLNTIYLIYKPSGNYLYAVEDLY